jgi:hypothetical protein
MNWTKAIRFGILIWLIIFVLVSVVLDLYQNTIWMKVVIAIVAGFVAFLLAAKAKPTSVKMALSYGLIWVGVVIILDAVITMRFNSGIFRLWALWLGYLLILIAPLFKIEEEKTKSSTNN